MRCGACIMVRVRAMMDDKGQRVKEAGTIYTGRDSWSCMTYRMPERVLYGSRRMKKKQEHIADALILIRDEKRLLR